LLISLYFFTIFAKIRFHQKAREEREERGNGRRRVTPQRSDNLKTLIFNYARRAQVNTFPHRFVGNKVAERYEAVEESLSVSR
jgi:hypothetical protein